METKAVKKKQERPIPRFLYRFAKESALVFHTVESLFDCGAHQRVSEILNEQLERKWSVSDGEHWSALRIMISQGPLTWNDPKSIMNGHKRSKEVRWIT